jgi:phytoene synthase
MTPLEASYAHCEAVARRRAKNFYYSFRILPDVKRRSMCAVYAFMRECDDLSDEPREGGPAAARKALEAWRLDLDAALNGRLPEHPLWPAFSDTAARHAMPGRIFHEMIDGVSSDLEPREIRTFDDLYGYCYRVASVAGLATVHVFGFRDAAALLLAEKCGIAFQLTNIIRDVREDALNGRVYLPAEDLERFGVVRDHLRAAHVAEPLRELLSFEGRRAEEYYAQSRPLIAMVERDSRAALWALIEIYARLLRKIKARRYEVLDQRVRLSGLEKSVVALRAMAGLTG